MPKFSPLLVVDDASVRGSAEALAQVAADRRAFAKKAIRQVQVLRRQREKQRDRHQWRVGASFAEAAKEEDRRRSQLVATWVAHEVAKFWQGCFKVAKHADALRNDALDRKRRMEGMEALVLRTEALSHQVSKQLGGVNQAQGVPDDASREDQDSATERVGEEGGESEELEVDCEVEADGNDMEVEVDADDAEQSKEQSPIKHDQDERRAQVMPSAGHAGEAQGALKDGDRGTLQNTGGSASGLESTLQTYARELIDETAFDRKALSKQVTTQVPALLLRHPIREYQHVGLHWLATLHDRQFNGILADEMGLGKTIMTIALFAHLAVEKEIWGPHLIIVPTSVLVNWEMEIKKWAPGLKVLAYYGSMQERRSKRRGWYSEDAFHVCIVSYTVVIQDMRLFRLKRWHYMVLDEAHHIKNFRSKKWQELIRMNTARRLLLTGTPLQNDLMELWSLMHFLMPDIFGSYTDFKAWFSDPLTTAIQKQEVSKEGGLISRLHEVLRPFMLRRLKCEVEKQMPKKYEYVERCAMSRRQQVLYDEFLRRRETRSILKRGQYISMMNIMMQLRKVCNHPELFEPRHAMTPFTMEPLLYFVPAMILLRLWAAVGGKHRAEDFACSILAPLVNMWRYEVTWMKAAEVPAMCYETHGVIPTLGPVAKRRRVEINAKVPSPVPDLPFRLRPNRFSKSSNFLEVARQQFAKAVTEQQVCRDNTFHALNTLTWSTLHGRPCWGVDGLDLLNLSGGGATPAASPFSRRRTLSAPMAVNPWATRARRQVIEIMEFGEIMECESDDGADATRKRDEQPRSARVNRRAWRLQRHLNPRWDEQTTALGWICQAVYNDIRSSRRALVLNWTLRVPRAQPMRLAARSCVWPSDDTQLKAGRWTCEALKRALERSRTFPMLHVSLCMHRHTEYGPLLKISQREEFAALREARHIRSSMYDTVADVEARMVCRLPEKHFLESDCGKLARLKVLLRSCQSKGFKCIIFTQFSKMLDVLESFVNYNRFTYLRLDGSVKIDTRQALVERFNLDDRIFLFISSTRAGGVGINLTGANVVIFYDSDWNPAMDRQATDRAHRIGQTRDVHIYRLISEHTIEENIWRRQLQKRQLDDVVVDQGRFNTETLSGFQKAKGKELAMTSAEVKSILAGAQRGALAGASREAGFDVFAQTATSQDAAADCSRGGHKEASTADMARYERALQIVEDEDDAQLAKVAGSELQEAEQALDDDFQEPAGAAASHSASGSQEGRKLEAATRSDGPKGWFEQLPAVVRWGACRLAALGLLGEDAPSTLAQPTGVAGRTSQSLGAGKRARTSVACGGVAGHTVKRGRLLGFQKLHGYEVA